MLDDHRGRAVELEREQPRGGEVGEVVERERLALELLDPREEVRARAALGVVRRALVRVLAVGELEDALEDGHVASRGSLVPRRASPRRAVERGGGLEGAGRERAPRRLRDLGVDAELLDERLVVLGAAERDDVRVVLRGRAQEGRAADVDLLDRLLPARRRAARSCAGTDRG